MSEPSQRRLVNLLREVAPFEGRAPWYTQRYMLERLEEEIVRAQRYGGSLTVVLGEVDVEESEETVHGEVGQAATWIVEQISRTKRRCDVAGQYGPQGFMLLLTQTDEKGASHCCQRLRQHLEHPAGLLDSSGSLHVHFGIASFAAGARSVKSILRRAEEQLERGKLVSSAGG